MSDAEGQELVYFWAPRGEERVFDLRAWPAEALHLVQSMLDTSDVAHSWEDGQLVVASAQRDEVQEILDEVVEANRPRLEEDEDRTAYELGEWPPGEIGALEAALEDAGILREWTEEGDLLVYESDEPRVDALFEELGLRGSDDGLVVLEGEGLSALLDTVYLGADRLSRDPADPDAVVRYAEATATLGGVAVPVGFEEDAWSRLQADATALRDLLADPDADDDDESVSERARVVRDHLRPWL
ncbi:MAG: hypothetical protein GEV08_05180 [Acidimicrobiia bacterium]|nr:hypothetical protein [Acidimicrobiia bacterium]